MSDDLDAIEARSDDAMMHESLEPADYAELAWASTRDVPALIAMVRERDAVIERVRELAKKWHKQFEEARPDDLIADALDDEAYKIEDIVNGTDYAALTATEGEG